MGFDGFDEMVGVIALVRQDEVSVVASDQLGSLGDVRDFCSGQTEAEWIAQGIDQDVNLAAKATTTAS